MIHAHIGNSGAADIQITGTIPEMIADAAAVVAAAARAIGAKYAERQRGRDVNYREAHFFALLQIHNEAQIQLGIVERGYEGPIPSAYHRLKGLREEGGVEDD